MVRYLFYTIGDLTYQSPLVFTRDTNTCRANGGSRQKSGIQKVTSNRADDWFRRACNLETLLVTTWYAPETEVIIWHQLARFISKPHRSREIGLLKNKQQQNLMAKWLGGNNFKIPTAFQ